ncbi:hypothetical protein [Methanohalophilus portucalensis]|uniref:Uncharacterized protein n=2 Tax=Methanohalophilus portucalensis TaxID=39664 RepID=A0A1L9C3N3_9EURY|nr:hypothetical protein [Methanohalophilus portucalensis]ATU07446.1 hypothetical protein BKM01_00805 [Methanohalophilus portucalensis]OJH49097.1 hypothetical protein MPF_1599 [Methanohalophilus portucalensis FDF-1]RNI08102.1 hypothetical protein EFE41_10650 [Methanohalophilus portucalensis FDF-1]SMH39186.1 hypothetical protein SAMN06264941_1357 [Methanohalophilus portucalensis FDF-1]
MSDKMKKLPVIQRPEPKEETPSCGGCNSKGNCNHWGIRPGSEKEEVYRNVLIYLTMGIVIIITALLIKALISSF